MSATPEHEPREACVDLVVKVGGSLLAHPAALDRVLAALAAGSSPLLVVPGGGRFAETVRVVDRERRLPDEAAHWMAVLAMDQYAYVVAAGIDRAILVRTPQEIAAACLDRRVPVLAPFAWLRAADPLPHGWDVTSDSIAAWVAGVVGASRVVLVKAPHAAGALVDPWFDRALPAGVQAVVVPADRDDVLAGALGAADGAAGLPAR